MIFSLSMKIVFCISTTILSLNIFFKHFFLVLLIFFQDLHQRHLLERHKFNFESRSSLSFFKCKLPVIGSLFQSLFFYIVLRGNAISYIHIVFVCFPPSIKSGVLDVVVFLSPILALLEISLKHGPFPSCIDLVCNFTYIFISRRYSSSIL